MTTAKSNHFGLGHRLLPRTNYRNPPKWGIPIGPLLAPLGVHHTGCSQQIQVEMSTTRAVPPRRASRGSSSNPFDDDDSEGDTNDVNDGDEEMGTNAHIRSFVPPVPQQSTYGPLKTNMMSGSPASKAKSMSQQRLLPGGRNKDTEEDDVRAGLRAAVAALRDPDVTRAQDNSTNSSHERNDDRESLRATMASIRQSSDRKGFRKMMQNADKRMRQSGVGHSVVCIDGSDENKVIRFLVSERVFGYPGSTGSWMSNYMNYVKNTHPMLSLILANRLHPFSLRNRFVVFLCILLLAVVLSFVFWNTNYVPQLSMCREGCDYAHLVNIVNTTNSSALNVTNVTAADFLWNLEVVAVAYNVGINSTNATNTTGTASVCIGGYNDGLSRGLYNDKFGKECGA
jgi:hypothetical protein